MLTFLRCGLKYWWFFFYFSDRIRKKPTFVYYIRYYFEEYIQHILRYAEVLTWLLYVDSLL